MPEDERPALTTIRGNLRERIKILRQTEHHRRDRRRWMKERVDFTKNPFKHLSKLLGDKSSEQMKATEEEVEQHLHQVHSDPRREESLEWRMEKMEKLIKPSEPAIQFRADEPSWKKVNDFLKKASGKSAPGPNGILYKVYKCCERLRRSL